MDADQICFLSATEMVARLRRRDLSARELMSAHLDQIDRLNPLVNAIVSRVPSEKLLAAAEEADKILDSGVGIGPLTGIPMAHKDLTDTKGIRTTSGSPIYADRIPTENSLIVERMQAAGVITIGKTNVPEFGAGSHTFNPIFGPSRNPYNLSKTVGGSSGGAGAALACGMVPLADGGDHGGSLRNPGNFNNIVGFRPSAGRVPSYPSALGWYPMSVLGPMARTVEDVALLLSVLAGPDSRSPISLSEPGETFLAPLERDFSEVKVAWSPDLGELPVDPVVTAVLESQLKVFDELGCTVEEATPDFRNADSIFKTWRAWSMTARHKEHLEKHRHLVKETVIWNTEAGLALTGVELMEAEKQRTELYHRVRRFMETYEFLLLPVNQVPPFDIEVEYPTEIAGVEMETYIDWMKSCYYITVTGHPAISVPCGFTPDGLPVGIQIVGRHQHDFAVLQLAHAFERATQVYRNRPPIVSA